jgi:D-glycero-alpha-D-manno-heptose-7-phosphate kinase
MIIRSRAPLRLGLAGGGTDVSPYCEEYGSYILNATIDRYAYSVIKTLEKKEVHFHATDQQLTEIIKLKNIDDKTAQLKLHKSVYLYMIKNFNNNNLIPLELSTYCDAPVGSGLGSSSTLVVAMVKAFVELLNLPLSDYEIAKIAYTIERVDCGLQGGRQDQYSATFGGFNFMEFYGNDKTIINTLRIKDWIVCELEGSLLLYFTGVSRESANIIKEQSDTISSKNSISLEAMHGIKKEAVTMKECLLKGDFKGVVESIRLGWESKKKSATSVSNSSIDEIYSEAIKAGALAGKVSGAGGGGFMWFFVPTEKRMNVVRKLQSFSGIVSNCHFTKNGTQAWRIQ